VADQNPADLRVATDPRVRLRNPRITYRGPGIVPLGTSTSAITSTSIPISSAIATPRITNHTAGTNDQLPLCLTSELPIAVTIGEATTNATSPPSSARSGERRRPNNRRTANAYTSTVKTMPMTNTGAETAIIQAPPIRLPAAQQPEFVRPNRRPGLAGTRILLPGRPRPGRRASRSCLIHPVPRHPHGPPAHPRRAQLGLEAERRVAVGDQQTSAERWPRLPADVLGRLSRPRARPPELSVTNLVAHPDRDPRRNHPGRHLQYRRWRPGRLS
jgi:hypothetical protein